MKKKFIAMMLVLCISGLSTGCVKIIDKGTEGQYTGKVKFDAAGSAEGLWESVEADISDNAVELSTLLTEAGGKMSTVAEKYGVNGKNNFAVKGSGIVTIVDTSKSAGYIVVDLDDYDGSEEIRIQVGPTFKNKDALGDAQTVTSFEDYTNQTEWGQVKDALIENVKTHVTGDLDTKNLEGKTIDFAGAFSASAGSSEIQIIPISLTVQ